jgi:hypothetical protein
MFLKTHFKEGLWPKICKLSMENKYDDKLYKVFKKTSVVL